MTAAPAVRHLQLLDELINKVVREAELIHDYAELRFHGGWVLRLNNGVELDRATLSNSPAGRTLLASLIGRAVSDVERVADELVLIFRGGCTLRMSLQSPAPHGIEPLQLSAHPAAGARPCSAN